jgi:hypothetical protein
MDRLLPHAIRDWEEYETRYLGRWWEIRRCWHVSISFGPQLYTSDEMPIYQIAIAGGDSQHTHFLFGPNHVQEEAVYEYTDWVRRLVTLACRNGGDPLV